MSRVVSSLTNETVKAARALHLRKAREESGRFLAEGLKIVAEAVELGFPPRIVMHTAEMAKHPVLLRVVAAAQAHGGEAVEVTREVLEKVSKRDNPQTVVAVFEQRFAALEALRPEAAATWVALEAVRDPGNLGTIIRTADAAGCGGVILVGDCVDPYSVEGVRATMGSIFALSIARADRSEFLAWRRRWPGAVVGTRLQATVDHRSAEYRRPTLLLMGNEQAGLTQELAAACDVNVKIPMRGRADSLNLAVATGIMIYAALPE
ncbi:MAG: RNA methyltransferase [Proteobacteria bacterium]|nr:RNA methyltransferase [Pseudomonadota bacterium]